MLNGAVSVSGTTPTINAKAGVRYVCAESTPVSTITFVPSATGLCAVRFTAGTGCVLSFGSNSSNIKLPEWFDYENLEAGRTYEINIEDGEFGAVISWA